MIGKLPENVLQAILETIPIEFSVIDKNEKVLSVEQACDTDFQTT